ncbi:MAG: phosphodiester glycosidase family protein [Nitrospira sp.]|nr:phosphodiester glycosidase family protein [Nitrospira sp.]
MMPTALSSVSRYRLRICGVVLALLLSLHVSRAESILWEPLANGLAVSVWLPGKSCPAVPSLLAIDIDPDRTRFTVHHYAQEHLSHPPTIEEWHKRSSHAALFNAGLFRENFAYLGLLYKDGQSLGGRRHATWQGLFVAEPAVAGLKSARVMDLTVEDFDEARPPYREAAQALMLLDHRRNIRVPQTGKRAYQTIVAETDRGHILIFKSRDRMTLYDIAQCLRDIMPSVRQAMAMDGGSSSDVLVSESLWQKDRHTEDYLSWKTLFGGGSVAHIPLPTVIGVSPR